MEKETRQPRQEQGISEEPLYAWVSGVLKHRIQAGEYSGGERLPSIATLCVEFGVSDITVRAAIRDLVQLGLVETQKRRGVFVCERAAALPIPTGKRVVATVFTESNTHFSSIILRAIEDECRAQGYQVLMTSTRGEAALERRLLLELSEQVAGIIMMPYLLRDHSACAQLVEDGFPLVTVDQYIRDLPIPAVTTDNVWGGYIATQHLIEQGRRDIIFLGQLHETSVADRLRGYQKALTENDIPYREENIFSIESGAEGEIYRAAHQEVLRRLGAGKRIKPFAAFGSNDFFARSFCVAALEAGLRIPQDVAVVGYDDVIAAFCHPPLSSVHQDLSKMGKNAVQLLVECMAAPAASAPAISKEKNAKASKKARIITLKPRLAVRHSSVENSGFSMAAHITRQPPQE